VLLDFPHPDQELYNGLPLRDAGPGLAGEVVYVTYYKSLEEKSHACIAALGINAPDIICDIVNGQVWSFRTWVTGSGGEPF
jgi:hypothetical protein